MKSFAVIASVAGVAAAQSLGSCAQMCADNMAKIANTELQCGAGDIACFCSKSNWAYGVRDCSAQACNANEAAQAVAWATSQCSNIASGAASASAALPILSSAVASASEVIASASAVVSSAASGGAQSVPVSTVPLLATITNSAGSVVTQTTGFSTLYSSLTGSAANAASSVAASLSSAQESLASSASSAVASAASSASAALSSAASSLASAASSARASATGAPSSGAAVPMMTAMPLAAAAGAAAMFFL